MEDRSQNPTPEDIESGRVTLNNFHGYFPGGYFRECEWLQEIFEEDKRRGNMVRDLDKLLEEDSFDKGEYLRLITRGTDNQGRNFKEVLLVYYKKMRELGYSYIELTG